MPSFTKPLGVLCVVFLMPELVACGGRRPQMIDTGTTHTGFRCVVRIDKGADSS